MRDTVEKLLYLILFASLTIMGAVLFGITLGGL